MFIVYRKKEYAAILADFYSEKEVTSLRAPKLTHVAPCVFAAHAGNWQPSYEILESLRVFLLESPDSKNYEQITEFLEKEGNSYYQKWCNNWKTETIDVRVPIILTGEYRHSGDKESEVSSTCIIVETANGFKAKRCQDLLLAYDVDVSNTVISVFNTPMIQHLLNSGPLSLAQALKALHAFASHICKYISPDCSIVIIGENDEYHVLEGQIVDFPIKSLFYG